MRASIHLDKAAWVKYNLTPKTKKTVKKRRLEPRSKIESEGDDMQKEAARRRVYIFSWVYQVSIDIIDRFPLNRERPTRSVGRFCSLPTTELTSCYLLSVICLLFAVCCFIMMVIWSHVEDIDENYILAFAALNGVSEPPNLQVSSLTSDHGSSSEILVLFYWLIETLNY